MVIGLMIFPSQNNLFVHIYTKPKLSVGSCNTSYFTSLHLSVIVSTQGSGVAT